MKKPWYVYILVCADGSYYTGITTDIEQRLKAHNSGKGARYTRLKGPVELVYKEYQPDRAHAMKKEIQIKSMPRAKKEQLVNKTRLVKTLPKLIPRPRASHKGNYGKVLVLAGSLGMTGAAYLCCKAALRSGSGLVLLGIPQSLLPIMAAKLTCSMTYSLPETSQGTLAFGSLKEIIRLAKDSDIIAIGPGISQHPQTSELVKGLLTRLDIPIVLDADGINAIRDNPTILAKVSVPLVITPHPGELARLINKPISFIQAHRVQVASDFAQRYKVIVVLKGHQTVVTEGEQLYINQTGNPGMATGGSGDVLTGVIAGLLGQGYQAFAAAQLGVYLHGLAGDLAAKDKGEISLIATDILEYLPRAFQKYIRKV